MNIIRDSEEGPHLGFLDLVFNIALFFIMIILLFSLLPVSKEQKTEAADIMGNLFITIRWPPSAPQDIDLWVQGPDGAPVGYSSSRSETFSYLRDDLGAATYKEMNYELAVSQNLVKGRYIVNLHFYSEHGGEGSVPVEANVILRSKEGWLSEIFKQTVILEKLGDEITVTQFQLDENGWVVPGSASNLFIPIRNKEKTFE